MIMQTAPFIYLLILISFFGCKQDSKIDVSELSDYYSHTSIEIEDADSMLLELTPIAGPEVVPSPSCLAVLPTGELFVGVDMMGSLGKEPGKGRIMRIADKDNDGNYEQITEFVKVDNPRGIMAMGNQVFVLHAVFNDSTKIAERMDLVVFEDQNKDGIADGPSIPLIKNICSPAILSKRGTDHATNGIRMGIDGWIYIAVGDFGFHQAVDRSGTKLTMLGGGVVRVRPDGTEMEIYAHGTRNIYDVAIDPFMNLYTRGNTNDGGGWNIRFNHIFQTGEYGYPSLFKNFTNEIIPALADLGGGSGTGSYFMDDDRWPEQFNHVPMMADWGRNQLFIHYVDMDGPTFTQNEKAFIDLSQITDVDVDGSGRMYLSAWDGASYTGSPDKGFVVKVAPIDLEYEPFPELEKASLEELGKLLQATNGVSRLHAQQELLKRPESEVADISLQIAKDTAIHLASRVAALYTYTQVTCENGIAELMKISEEPKMREFALRALTDRKPCLETVPLDLFIENLKDPNPRVRAAAIVGLGRMGQPEAAEALLKLETPNTKRPEKGTEGPHATPNPDIILPHLTVKALVQLNAIDACLRAIDTNPHLALWALSYLHDAKTVSGLVAAYEASDHEALKREILHTLARLYQQEADYDGSTWWGTRPDTHGPYYYSTTWDASGDINSFLTKELKSNPSQKDFFTGLNERYRLKISELGTAYTEKSHEQPQVDLEAIKNKKGQVGKSSIEDVIVAMGETKGDAVQGKALFIQQGCIACHSVEKGDAMKGPFMGQIGSIMTRNQIAESILKPNASISQGFASILIKTKQGKTYMGFVTAESAEALTIRDIAGNATEIIKEDIESRKELENSMMPPGLVNALSFEELASLITYLEQQK
ncbi:MAG: HEAT repeat domain-containing protein [Marinoscillum sp.]